MQWLDYWCKTRFDWYTDLGINPDNLRHYEHPKEKLSHYSKRTVDVEYKFGFSCWPRCICDGLESCNEYGRMVLFNWW